MSVRRQQPDDIAPPPAAGQPNRRTRLDATIEPRLRGWLIRATRTHAHLCSIVRLYGAPSKAGGQSLLGEGYASRAARGDQTLLFDCVSFCRDELAEVATEILACMDAAPATSAAPGTPEKVAALVERASRGESLFIDGDGKTFLG